MRGLIGARESCDEVTGIEQFCSGQAGVETEPDINDVDGADELVHAGIDEFGLEPAEGHSAVGVESLPSTGVVRVEVGGDVDGDEAAGAVRGPVGDECGDVLGQSAPAAGAEDPVEDEVRAREFAQGVGTRRFGLRRRECDDLCACTPCRGQPLVVSAIEEGDDRDGGSAPAQGRRGEEGVSGVVSWSREDAHEYR